jgi:hypothetical protein
MICHGERTWVSQSDNLERRHVGTLFHTLMVNAHINFLNTSPLQYFDKACQYHVDL